MMNYSFTHYFLRNYREAIEGFASIANDSKNEDLLPYALLMLGKCFKDMGLKKEARLYFTKIEKKYRESDVYKDTIDEMKDL